MAEWSDIVQQIYAAAGDPDRGRTLATIADIETGAGREFSNPRSSARGLYHFLDENRRWADKQGTPYGEDAASNTRAMLAKMDSDKAYAAKRGLAQLEPWQEYILHYQGGPTGSTLLTSDRGAPLADALGARAGVILKANPNLNKYPTVGAMLDDYKGIYERRAARYGAEPSANGSDVAARTVPNTLPATVLATNTLPAEPSAPAAGTFSGMLAKLAAPDAKGQSPLGSMIGGLGKAAQGSSPNSLAKEHEAGMKAIAVAEAEQAQRAQFAKQYMQALRKRGAFSGGSGNA